jgi:hypothetical protein
MALFGEVVRGVWVALCLLLPWELPNRPKVRYKPWLSFVLWTYFNLQDSASVVPLLCFSAEEAGMIDLVDIVIGALLV